MEFAMILKLQDLVNENRNSSFEDKMENLHPKIIPAM